jgi:hypothetical protein
MGPLVSLRDVRGADGETAQLLANAPDFSVVTLQDVPEQMTAPNM